MATNLLKNPDGNDNMNNWQVVANGGNGWKVEEMPGACGHPFNNNKVTKYFASSFELCLKKQVINLLDHFTTAQLDAAPPVTVEDWYCCRTDCGATYQITVCLLDEKKENIERFEPHVVTLDPATNHSWLKVSHTFSDYGPGVRYVSFEHGGKDTKFWQGWYGVRVTDSSVTVAV